MVPAKQAPNWDLLIKVSEFPSLETGALREGATESFSVVNVRSGNIRA